MGWAVGFDPNWKRDVGYGVPSICDHPSCTKQIDRGLGYVCGGDIYGGEDGCGLFFCGEHGGHFQCERCLKGEEPFDPKPDTAEWIDWKLTDPIAPKPDYAIICGPKQVRLAGIEKPERKTAARAAHTGEG